MEALSLTLSVIRRDWRRLLLWGIAFSLAFQVLMLGALIVRFQALPNYVTFYNWIGNVWWIVQSTPSWSDMAPIIAEEWLIEIGKMNYDYGTGISEWSLNVVPSRLLVLTAMGALAGLCLRLSGEAACGIGDRRTLRATTGLGAGLIAMTNATMSWVVCCATPSWVVGLAMLGLGVSTSLALETMGPWLTGAGFGLLLLTAAVLAVRASRRQVERMEARHA